MVVVHGGDATGVFIFQDARFITSDADGYGSDDGMTTTAGLNRVGKSCFSAREFSDLVVGIVLVLLGSN